MGKSYFEIKEYEWTNNPPPKLTYREERKIEAVIKNGPFKIAAEFVADTVRRYIKRSRYNARTC